MISSDALDTAHNTAPGVELFHDTCHVVWAQLLQYFPKMTGSKIKDKMILDELTFIMFVGRTEFYHWYLRMTWLVIVCGARVYCAHPKSKLMKVIGIMFRWTKHEVYEITSMFPFQKHFSGSSLHFCDCLAADKILCKSLRTWFGYIKVLSHYISSQTYTKSPFQLDTCYVLMIVRRVSGCQESYRPARPNILDWQLIHMKLCIRPKQQ